MKKIYKIHETYYNEDGESDVYTRLRDEPLEDISDDNYKLVCTKATKKNVSLDDLASAVDSELENWNYHSMVGLGAWVAEHLKRGMGEEKAKDVFWDMVQEKGFVWTF